MRILLALLCLSLSGILSLRAASVHSTSDRLTISDLTIDPGGASGTLTIHLEGIEGRHYTAYNLDLHLPSGLTVCSNSSGLPDVALVKGVSGIYPYYEEEEDGDIVRSYTHTLSSSYNMVGDNILRIACFSSANEPLTATSGSLVRIRVAASAYTRPGNYNISIDGVTLVTMEYSNEVLQYVPTAPMEGSVTVTTTSSVSVVVTETNHFGTLILPFSASLPEGLEAYSCSNASDEELYLSSAQRLDAFTPYILYSDKGYSGALSGTIDTTIYVASAQCGYLCGHLTNTEITEGFIMQNKGDGAQFYMVAPYTYALAAGKCYVMLPTDLGQNAPVLRISREINSILPHPHLDNIAPTGSYNLQGQSTQKDSWGIIISNGRKMIRVAR